MVEQNVIDEKNVKKIICYRGDRSSCWANRAHFPLSYLARNHEDEYWITITGMLDSKQIGKFDLAIMQRQYKADVFNPMLLMKKSGTKIIYEIDDDMFSVPQWNPAYAVLGKKVVQDNVKQFLEHVDAVFTTNDYLADVYRPFCSKVYVLPNSIDYGVIHPNRPNNSIKKVVCWQGSQTHERDFAIAANSLQRLVKDPDVMLKLWSIKSDIKEAYVVPFVAFESFYQMFAQLDGIIGIAPLTTIPFNRSKSNLKFLEYSVYGMATIASNFGPYAETIEHEKTGLLISDNRDWYDAIRYLLDHEDIRTTLVENAQKLVKEKYDISKNYLLWKTAIDEVLAS